MLCLFWHTLFGILLRMAQHPLGGGGKTSRDSGREYLLHRLFWRMNEKTMGRIKRKKQRKWPQMIVAAMIGGVCGYFGMMFVEKIHGGKVGTAEILMGLGWMILCLYAAAFLQTIVHEGGHLVCGLLSGYKFSSFRVGKVILVKKSDGLKWGRYSLMGTGGQCLLAPPDLVNGNMPYLLYNLGGSLFNLLLAAASLLICFAADEHGYLQILFMTLFNVGVFLALMNAIPMRLSGVNNDGYNALHLGKNKEAVRCLWLQLKMNEQLTMGVRLKDMPQEWFEPVPEELWNNSMCAAAGVFAASRNIDQQDFFAALEIGERVLEYASGLIGIQKSMLEAEMIFCRLMLNGPGEELRREYEKAGVQRFLKQSSSMLSVLRIQYACELIQNQDEAAARKWLGMFEKAGKHYPFDGDIASERELLACIDGLRNIKKG